MFIRSIFLILVLLVLVWPASAQSSARGTASITGRVTANDRPMPGVMVAIFTSSFTGPRREPLYRATTDEEGRYRFSAIPAGQYRVVPLAPGYAVPTEGFGLDGKPVTLGDGEAFDNLDFALIRGGVITGRVTDANDQPVIEEQINLTEVEPGGRSRRVFLGNFLLMRTDDRGIYRIYGVQPGRYLISVGQASNVVATFGAGRPAMPQTFHPGTTEEKEATPIEVSEGSETTRIDIIVGKPANIYDASGRVVEAETGKPVANIGYSCVTVTPDGPRGFSFGLSTNAKGDFQITGLKPGKYRLSITDENNSNYYSEPLNFEVINGNVTGLELKARRGASVSGTVLVEGTSDPQIVSKVSQINIRVRTDEKGSPASSGGVKIQPDGSFVVTGLPPGKNIFFIIPFGTPKGFSIARVERDGVNVTGGIDLQAGDQVTGVKLVFSYGTSVLRGEVKIVGGTLPEGARLTASIYPGAKSTNPKTPLNFVSVDTRGRFIFEGLSAGDYELQVNAFIPGQSGRSPVRQPVTIIGGEADVTVTLDLTPKEEEQTK